MAKSKKPVADVAARTTPVRVSLLDDREILRASDRDAAYARTRVPSAREFHAIIGGGRREVRFEE